MRTPMLAFFKMPSWTSCQMGLTSSRREKRTVALPVFPSSQALSMTPMTSDSRMSRWESSSGALPLFSRPRRTCAGSMLKVSSKGPPKPYRRTVEPVYQIRPMVRFSASLFSCAKVASRRCGAIRRRSTLPSRWTTSTSVLVIFSGIVLLDRFFLSRAALGNLARVAIEHDAALIEQAVDLGDLLELRVGVVTLLGNRLPQRQRAGADAVERGHRVLVRVHAAEPGRRPFGFEGPGLRDRTRRERHVDEPVPRGDAQHRDERQPPEQLDAVAEAEQAGAVGRVVHAREVAG